MSCDRLSEQTTVLLAVFHPLRKRILKVLLRVFVRSEIDIQEQNR